MDKEKNNKNDEVSDVELTDEQQTDYGDDLELDEIEENTASKIKDLREKVKQIELEKRVAQEEVQRVKAEYLNSKRRLEQDKNTQISREKIRFVESLLPLCDSFSMAMSDTDKWQSIDQNWRKGVEGIHSQLESILQQYQVEKVDPINNEFDPNIHEAISEEEVDEEKLQNTVVKVIQYGYRMPGEDGEMVTIRPARVVVGTKK